MNALHRWCYALLNVRNFVDHLGRRVVVENILASVAAGKRPLLQPQDCRELARYLGTPGYELPGWVTRPDGVKGPEHG